MSFQDIQIDGALDGRGAGYSGGPSPSGPGSPGLQGDSYPGNYSAGYSGGPSPSGPGSSGLQGDSYPGK